MNVVTVGKRAPLADATGRAVAADLRAGVAQIQKASSMLPAETVGQPKEEGSGVEKHFKLNDRGDAMRKASNRYGAENSIALRREMVRRGLDDPRWTTPGCARFINRAAGASQPALKLLGGHPKAAISGHLKSGHFG